MTRLALVSAAVFGYTVALAGGVTGTYVGTSTSGIFMIQFVQTGERNLTGHYRQTRMDKNGELHDINAAITGAVDGQTVVATIKTGGIFDSPIEVSGTIRDDMLRLSGGNSGGSFSLNLKRSNESAFGSQLAALTDKARVLRSNLEQQKQNARQVQDAQNELSQFSRAIVRLQNFVQNTPKILATLSQAEELYRNVTISMRHDLERQRVTGGGNNAASRRYQISVDIYQAAIPVYQQHLTVRDDERTFEYDVRTLLTDISELRQMCEGMKPSAMTAEAMLPNCGKFFEAEREFLKQTKLVREAYASAEHIWFMENQKQEAIVKQANLMVKATATQM